MKALILLAGILGPMAANAGDIETAYARFDDLRSSNAPAAEKAYGVVEYFSILFRIEAQPASFGGCLQTLQIGLGSSDPCMPVSARVIEGGGSTGGVD